MALILPSRPEFLIEYERPHLYPKQYAAIYDPHRFSLVEASTKAGKTSGCIAWIIEQALAGESGWNYWWVAPVSDQALIAFRRSMRSLPQDVFTPNISLKTITLLNGTVVWFKSGDKPNCYDEKTEILTDEGWKKFGDLSGTEQVMTRSSAGCAEWQAPTQIIRQQYAGDMVVIENKRIDLCVTPNHRMLVERRRGLVRRGKWNRSGARTGKTTNKKEMIVDAGRLMTHDTIPAQMIWTGVDQEYLTTDICALLGFYLAEGSAIWNSSTNPHERVKRSGYRIHFAQIAGKKGGIKGDVRAEFCELLKRLHLKYRERHDGLLIWNKELWEWLINLGNKYTKYIPAGIKDLPHAKLKVLLHWLILGDGWIRAKDCGYFTVSRRLADDVQEIALKCGWGATIRERAPMPFSRPGKTYTAALGYVLSFQRYTKSHHLQGQHGSYIRRVPYDGTVHCCTVPNGVVLVRRNGKPIWSGNSLYGEDVYGVVVDEASRMKEDAYIAIRSTLTYTRAPIRIIGNVRGRKNWFFKLARRAEHDQIAGLEPREMGYHKIIAGDAVAAGVLDAKEIEDARTQMPEQAWRELYQAEPSDDGGNPFGMDHIAACVKPLSTKPPRSWGWDFAKKRDYTVGIGLDEDGATCRFERFHQVPWGETMNRVVSLTGNTPALGDSTGVGDPIVEEIQRKLGETFQGYHFTQSSKQKLMEGLAVAIQARTVWYPEGVIVSELEQFEYQFTRTGVSYGAPEGYFDDCVIALSLANMCRVIVPPPVQISSDLLARARSMPRFRQH